MYYIILYLHNAHINVYKCKKNNNVACAAHLQFMLNNVHVGFDQSMPVLRVAASACVAPVLRLRCACVAPARAVVDAAVAMVTGNGEPEGGQSASEGGERGPDQGDQQAVQVDGGGGSGGGGGGGGMSGT